MSHTTQYVIQYASTRFNDSRSAMYGMFSTREDALVRAQYYAHKQAQELGQENAVEVNYETDTVYVAGDAYAFRVCPVHAADTLCSAVDAEPQLTVF